METARALLGFAASPNIRDAAGRNALDIATALTEDSAKKRDQIIDLLVSFGADQDRDQYNRSIAFQAANVQLPSPDREAKLAKKPPSASYANGEENVQDQQVLYGRKDETISESKERSNYADNHKKLWAPTEEDQHESHYASYSNEWEQILDPDSQCYYWYNYNTGQSQWVES